MLAWINSAVVDLVTSFASPVNVTLAVEVVMGFKTTSPILTRATFAGIVMTGVAVFFVYAFTVQTTAVRASVGAYLKG